MTNNNYNNNDNNNDNNINSALFFHHVFQNGSPIAQVGTSEKM